MPHSVPCATFRSPHTPVVSILSHRLLYGTPIAAAFPPPHCGSKHWFWPRDWPCQRSEVCSDSKIDGMVLICMSY
ncbi:unnamed protein product [Staurois parvus]|uniref:Uncharacterized protein n=1 Tax=Staurois parvus TaxID=386267 RepID=A0ABN9D5A7_9NEOB|nr:unnamed protein product [Staurois parvus]